MFEGGLAGTSLNNFAVNPASEQPAQQTDVVAKRERRLANGHLLSRAAAAPANGTPKAGKTNTGRRAAADGQTEGQPSGRAADRQRIFYLPTFAPAANKAFAGRSADCGVPAVVVARAVETQQVSPSVYLSIRLSPVARKESLVCGAASKRTMR